jgi:hypothetical protein
MIWGAERRACEVAEGFGEWTSPSRANLRDAMDAQRARSAVLRLGAAVPARPGKGAHPSSRSFGQIAWSQPILKDLDLPHPDRHRRQPQDAAPTENSDEPVKALTVLVLLADVVAFGETLAESGVSCPVASGHRDAGRKPTDLRSS